MAATMPARSVHLPQVAAEALSPPAENNGGQQQQRESNSGCRSSCRATGSPVSGETY